MRKLLFILALIFWLPACNNDEEGLRFSDLPAGDAARGAELFAQQINGAPACTSCHLETESSAPVMAGYGERAGSRVRGESAEEYTLNSIINPASHIVDGYSNLMYRDYEDKLTQQQIADLIAYLLTQ